MVAPRRWREAAGAFCAHEMAYQEALMLFRRASRAWSVLGHDLGRLGASRLLAMPLLVL
jgi:hypothetical protein